MGIDNDDRHQVKHNHMTLLFTKRFSMAHRSSSLFLLSSTLCKKGKMASCQRLSLPSKYLREFEVLVIERQISRYDKHKTVQFTRCNVQFLSTFFKQRLIIVYRLLNIAWAGVIRHVYYNIMYIWSSYSMSNVIFTIMNVQTNNSLA